MHEIAIRQQKNTLHEDKHAQALAIIEEIRVNRMSHSQRAAHRAARRNGTILETLTQKDAERLAMRYEPLPEVMRTDKGIENAIKEFGQLLAYQVDEKWGIQSSPQ